MRKRHNQRNKKRIPFKAFIFGGLFFCLLVGLIYFFIFSPFFLVEKIEITSTKELKYHTPKEIKEIIRNDLTAKLLWYIPRRNIAFIPINKIKQNILGEFPEIKSVVVSKKMPHFLSVKIEERESVGIWCKTREVVSDIPPAEQIEEETENEDGEEKVEEDLEEEPAEPLPETKKVVEKCFCIDREGVIYKESLLVRGHLVLNIFDAVNQSADIRVQVVSEKVMDFILAIKRKLPKIKTASQPLRAQDFEIVSIEDVRMMTSQGWKVYFNPAYPFNVQLEALEKLLAMNDIDYAALGYVDLRIAGRAYYDCEGCK